jgi:hypothetical protein
VQNIVGVILAGILAHGGRGNGTYHRTTPLEGAVVFVLCLAAAAWSASNLLRPLERRWRWGKLRSGPHASNFTIVASILFLLWVGGCVLADSLGSDSARHVLVPGALLVFVLILAAAIHDYIRAAIRNSEARKDLPKSESEGPPHDADA